MTVINADVHQTIISMTGNSKAAHVTVALSEVEIFSAVYKSIDKNKKINQLLSIES